VQDPTTRDRDFEPLLKVRGLQTYFYTEDGVVKAVDGVDLNVRKGEIFGLVGESGCGKTVTALSILRLIEKPGRIVGGDVHFDGTALHELDEIEMTDLRGQRISMIFQQPQSSLNPVFTVGGQVAEVLQIHKFMDKEESWERAVDMLARMGIPDAESKANAYPHELSGGQAQRVMIAIAMAIVPDLLIADEPTSALDVTVQAQILDLLLQMKNRMRSSIIVITHDLGVIAEVVERVAVMYAGRIVGEADVETLFENPQHPYTIGLMASVPVLGRVKEQLEVIPGSVPNMIDLPAGCRFAPRCRARIEHKLSICSEVEPELLPIKLDHTVRCWLYHNHENHNAPLKTD
jgi:oligopeptide/dipeptide ABC transporter ATP-binding protein